MLVATAEDTFAVGMRERSRDFTEDWWASSLTASQGGVPYALGRLLMRRIFNALRVSIVLRMSG